MYQKITSIALLFVCFVSAHGQILNYEVVKGSKKLGDMTVARTSENDEVRYDIESEVIFRLLFSFKIDYNSNAIYKNGALVFESTINKLNGSVQKESVLKEYGTGYQLQLNDSKSFQKGPIDYSVAAVYFVEPDDGQQVFSPQFGKYLTFKKIGDHKYEMESPDGINVYTYVNGVCSEVKVNRDFAKFYFRMTPETLYAVQNWPDSTSISNN